MVCSHSKPHFPGGVLAAESISEAALSELLLPELPVLMAVFAAFFAACAAVPEEEPAAPAAPAGCRIPPAVTGRVRSWDRGSVSAIRANA